MGKKKGVPATEVPGSSGDRVIDNLKILHDHLLKQVEGHHKQIQDTHIELASLAAGRDIARTIERVVFQLVISSGLDEAATRFSVAMAAAIEKAESAAAENGAAETRLLDLVREKDGVQRDLERILEERDSNLKLLEKVESERRIKKWVYSVAAAAIFLAFTVMVTFFFDSIY